MNQGIRSSKNHSNIFPVINKTQWVADSNISGKCYYLSAISLKKYDYGKPTGAADDILLI